MRAPSSTSIGRPAAAALVLALTLTSVASVGAWPGHGPDAVRAADASPAASADPTAAPEGGDARSPGEGAGLAGAPLAAVGLVLGIGLASAAVTLAYVRLTGGRAVPPR